MFPSLIIAASLVIGFLFAFVGLAFVVPILAHASWHLYRRVLRPAGVAHLSRKALTIMLARKPKLGMIAGVFAASFGAAPASMLMASPARLDSFETVDVAPRVFAYRLTGDFSQAGQSVDAPLVAVARTSVLHIMKQQVTVADYDRCVAETKCMARSPLEGFDPNLPAVQVSWQDAIAYAAWLSAKTGETWRLSTDEEWVFAAGSRFHDDALLVGASRDPSVRWLARYEKESDQEALDQLPRPPGAFGANEYGLLDLSGNVWEWTNTCFIRQSLDTKGKPAGASTVNCGYEPSKANTAPM